MRRLLPNCRFDSLLFWIAISAFCLLAVFHLSTVYLNLDVSWLLYAAKQLTQGQKLYLDIYETNPPIAVYFNLPAVWLIHYFGFPDSTGFYLYLFGIILISVSLTWKSIPLVFANSQPLIRTCMSLVIVFVAMVLPFGSMGQREHVVVLFTMPYVFLSIARAQGKTFNPLAAFTLGCLAGLGISFKPYFIFLVIFLESYLLFGARAGNPLRRPETLAIMLITFLSILLILLIFPGYLMIVDLLRKYYFAYNAPFVVLLFNDTFLMWLAACATLLLIKISSDDGYILYILFLASSAFLLSALIQQKGWPNHFYPSQAYSLIFFSVVLFRLTELSIDLQKFIRKGLQGVALLFVAGLLSLGLYYLLMFKSISDNGPLAPLISVVKEKAWHKPIYVLSTSLDPTFPLVNYANAYWPYHFHSLWLLPGIYRQQLGGAPSTQAKADMRFLLDTLMGDLERYPPALIIVDRRPDKIGFAGLPFDFLEYFNNNYRFAEFFSKYSIIGRVGYFYVFRRNE